MLKKQLGNWNNIFILIKQTFQIECLSAIRSLFSFDV